jgi:hypothetical protein
MIMPATALAADSVEISVIAQGIASAGIFNFKIVYVTEQRFDLSWILGSNVTSVMIRAKYNKYPNDITSTNETPSDGYLVYYGNGTSVSDTSMDLDQNPGGIYYRAWAQLGDGSWVITPSQDWKESKVMTLLGVLAIASVFTMVGIKYKIMRTVAAVAWIFVGLYWLQARPSSITAGTPADTAAIVLFFIAAAVVFVWPFTSSNGSNGEVGARFRLSMDRFMGREETPPSRSPNRGERIAAYRERLDRADRGER